MSAMKPTPVPFLDLSAQFARLEAEWLDSIRATGAAGSFILGPNVQAFERELADYVGVEHAVALANGTDALLLSLRALGVGPGDEVITTPYTFFATAEVISLVGARPVFVDIDDRCFNIDAAQIEAAVTSRTKAIMPVHLFGCPADMEGIGEVAAAHGLRIIEDCAQAFGATLSGRRVGSLGDTGCFSFYPTKVLGCYGDGGMLTTNDGALAEKVRQLRNHGAYAGFMHDAIGYNSRLDEVQAALLRIKLRSIEQDIAGRVRVASAYHSMFSDPRVVRPGAPPGARHVFNLYTVRVPARDRVRDALQSAKIGCSTCYPLPLHLQKVYSDLGYQPGDLPVCEQAARECLSVPMFPEMSAEQVGIVCRVVRGALP